MILHGLLGFILCWGIGVSFWIGFFCSPVEKFWNRQIDGHCSSLIPKFFVPSINLFTDFVVLFVPIPHIWKLKLERRDKIILLGILSLGAL